MNKYLNILFIYILLQYYFTEFHLSRQKDPASKHNSIKKDIKRIQFSNVLFTIKSKNCPVLN